MISKDGDVNPVAMQALVRKYILRRLKKGSNRASLLQQGAQKRSHSASRQHTSNLDNAPLNSVPDQKDTQNKSPKHFEKRQDMGQTPQTSRNAVSYHQSNAHISCDNYVSQQQSNSMPSSSSSRCESSVNVESRHQYLDERNTSSVLEFPSVNEIMRHVDFRTDFEREFYEALEVCLRIFDH